MSCLFCWNDSDEAYKKGAFLQASHKQINSKLGNSNRRSNKQRGSYLPWVFSRQFQQVYQWGPILGQGAFGVVHEVCTIEPPYQLYACKVVDHRRLNGPKDVAHLYNEMELLLELRNHPHILHLHELYKIPHAYYFLVTERLAGGELFDRLCEKQVYSEAQARDVCQTLFQAVAYCHARGIVHRDVKPENLLLVSPHDDGHVKLADFGLAKRTSDKLLTSCGSPSYMAPEIVDVVRPYDERVDNWSLGVLIYTILGGYNPFYRSSQHLTFQQIRQGAYQFVPHEYWDGISPDAKNLIRGLLQVNPDQRLTADEVLSHAWMTGRGDDLQGNVNLSKLKEYQVDRKKQSQMAARNVDFYWLTSRR